jgi:hypothetical protein
VEANTERRTDASFTGFGSLKPCCPATIRRDASQESYGTPAAATCSVTASQTRTATQIGCWNS